MTLSHLTKIDGAGISSTAHYHVGVIEGVVISPEATFSGDVSIGGTLTYEDVTNVDVVGVATFRDKVSIGSSLILTGANRLLIGNLQTTDEHISLRYVGTGQAGLLDFNIDEDQSFVRSSDMIGLRSYKNVQTPNLGRGYGIDIDDNKIIPSHDYKPQLGQSTRTFGTIFANEGNYSGIVTATSFVKSGGTSSQYLMADGSTTSGGGGPGTGESYVILRNSSNPPALSNTGKNIIIGVQAADKYGNGSATGGNENIFLGYTAGYTQTGGDGNVFLGAVAGYSNATSGGNTYIGHEAGRFATGANNVIIGRYAGNVGGFTGSNNIVIGQNSDPSSANVSNEITLGDSNINHLRVPGIGVSFSTNGNHITGVTTFSGEIHGNGQRLGSHSNSGRFSGLFLQDGYSYYGVNKIFTSSSNGFGLDAYGSMYSYLKANSGGGTAGDCWLKTGASSGGYLIAKGTNGVQLHHAGTSDKKLETTSSGVTVTGSVADSKGDLRSIPQQNEQGSTHTLVAADAGKHILADNTVTVPPTSGIFSAGDAITIVNAGSSDISIAKGSGVTMYNSADGTDAGRTLAAKGMATILCAGSNTYYISGAGLS